MKVLKDFFYSIENLSTDEMNFLLSHLETTEVKKGTQLFEAGDLVRSIFFLEKGILHHFNYAADGEQKTLSLHEAPCFCTDLESFSTTKRSEESCMAMTDCTIHELTKSNYEALVNTNLRWSNFVKKITERSLVKALGEIREIANKSVKERYFDLQLKRPRILQVVPLQIIASYLGTSRETLHRIRRGYALQNQ